VIDRVEEHGFAAVWVAVVLLFLLGSAALAVDASEFWEDARFERTVADLACLAGARHLPEDPDTARQKAVDFTKANWDVTRTLFPVTTGPGQVTLSDGTGSVVIITAPFGEGTKMKVEVVQEPATRFGVLLGSDSVTVRQQAYCKTFGLGPGMLPFGELPGSFDSTLQKKPPCGADAGNCKQLVLPRTDSSGNNAWLARNIALGAEIELEVGDLIETDTGVSANPLSDGYIREGYGIVGRFRNPAPDDNPWLTPGGRWEDGDPRDDVFDGTTPPPVGPPAGYNEDIQGPWDAHYYVTSINDCSSPRIAEIPIVAQPGWTPGTEPEWPPGTSDPVEVFGFHWVYLTDPNDPSDMTPSDTINEANGELIWFAPDILCTGPNAPTRPFEPGDPKVVRLVEG
jgi:hypothetical protein